MDEASILIELQDHDLRALRLNRQLDEMPEKRVILSARTKIAEIESILARTQAATRTIEASAKRLEDEIAVYNAKIEVEQAKLLSGQVKLPKELQAISLELSALKRRVDALENDLLAEMTKLETAAEQAAKVSAAIEAGRRKEKELVAAFKDRGGHLVAEIDALNAERERLAHGLSKPVRERYEALRQSRGGIAVGVLEEATCSVCRVGMPAGQLDGLLGGPDVGTCPMCHRMLIVRRP